MTKTAPEGLLGTRNRQGFEPHHPLRLLPDRAVQVEGTVEWKPNDATSTTLPGRSLVPVLGRPSTFKPGPAGPLEKTRGEDEATLTTTSAHCPGNEAWLLVS